MKELTKHEVCRLMAAINTEGLDNTQWTELKVLGTGNAKNLIGCDDENVILESGWYVCIYFHEEDDYPMFQRLMADIITDQEKCIVDADTCIFCIEK